MTTRSRLLLIPVVTLLAFAGLGLLTLVELRANRSESTEVAQSPPEADTRYAAQSAELAALRRAARELVTPVSFVAMVGKAARDGEPSTQEVLASFQALNARAPGCADKLVSALLPLWNEIKADGKANLSRVEEALTQVMLAATGALALDAGEREQLLAMLEDTSRRGSTLAPVIVLVLARLGTDVARLESIQANAVDVQLKAQIGKVLEELKRSSGKSA